MNIFNWLIASAVTFEYFRTLSKLQTKELNYSLTFAVSTSLALEAAPSAARQGPTVISVKFVGFDF